MNLVSLLKNLFVIELKRRLKLRDMIIFLFIFLIFIYFFNDGKNIYTHLCENKEVFQKIEQAKVNKYVLYTQYGTYGISILFIPSPFVVFYVDSGFNDILTNINSGDRLEIYKNLKGSAYFSGKSDLMNIRGVILLFAIFFSLLYGFDTTGKKEYLRFLSNLTNQWVLFFSLVFVRIGLLVLALFVIVGISLLSLSMSTIGLISLSLLYIFILAILLIIVFFFLGCIIGSLKKKTLVGIIAGIVYFVSIFFIPAIVDKHTRIHASDIESLYDFTLKNLSLLMEVEKRLTNKFGISTEEVAEPPEALERVKEALEREFEIIFSREDGMRSKMLNKIKYRQLLSNFFPVLFYNSVLEELSSCGGLSFIDFYEYSKKRKKEFIDFYVKKKFLSKGKSRGVESFVKNDENLYFSVSRLPTKFWLGILVNILYIIIVGVGAGIRFCFVLGAVNRKIITDKVIVDFRRGKDNHICTKDGAAIDHFYYKFSCGGKRYAGRIAIDGNFLKSGEKQSFIYLCNPKDIPGEMSVNDLLNLFKNFMYLNGKTLNELKSKIGSGLCRMRLGKLSIDDIVKVLLKIISCRRGYIYMFDGIINKCSDDFIQGEFAKQIDMLKSFDGLIIYFGDNTNYTSLKIDHHFLYYLTADGYVCEELRIPKNFFNYS